MSDCKMTDLNWPPKGDQMLSDSQSVYGAVVMYKLLDYFKCYIAVCCADLHLVTALAWVETALAQLVETALDSGGK